MISKLHGTKTRLNSKSATVSYATEFGCSGQWYVESISIISSLKVFLSVSLCYFIGYDPMVRCMTGLIWVETGMKAKLMGVISANNHQQEPKRKSNLFHLFVILSEIKAQRHALINWLEKDVRPSAGGRSSVLAVVSHSREVSS